MGFRYYTTVRFPTTAMSLPEVAQAVKDFRGIWGHRDVSDDGDFTVVSDEDANYGWMDDVTDVLNEFRVPYDHHHSESEGSSSMPWTDYVRWDGTGRELDEAQEAEARTGAELLGLLNAGELDQLRAQLEALAVRVPSDLAEDWQPDPAVVTAAREEREA
jgi:hypothetical protein